MTQTVGRPHVLKLTVLVATALAVTAATANANHWWFLTPGGPTIVHLQGGHHPGFGFYNGADQDSEVHLRFEYSRGHWNQPPYMTMGNVSNAAAAQVRAYDDFYGMTGWAGLATPQGWDGAHAAYFTVQANLTYMQMAGWTNTWQYKQAVTCHEIGHAVAGLADQTGTDASCMAVGYTARSGEWNTDGRYRVPSAHDRDHQRILWDQLH